MEVDINLLPIQKKKVSSGRKGYLVITLSVVLGLIAIGTTKYSLISEMDELKTEKAVLDSRMAQLESDLQKSGQDQRDQVLKAEVDEILADRMITSNVVQPLLDNLPGSASMLNISYKNDGSVTVLTEFNALVDVSTYQSNLLEQEGVNEVFLDKLSRTIGEKEGKKAEPSTAYYADLTITYDRSSFTEGGAKN